MSIAPMTPDQLTIYAMLGSSRKSVLRFSDKNLRQDKHLSGRCVGVPTQPCLVTVHHNLRALSRTC